MPPDTIAHQVATRDEATRIADHREALESLRLLGLPLAPPDPVLVIDHKRDQLLDIYTRDWQEFDGVASVQFAASAAVLEAAREESVRVYGEVV